MVEVAKVLGLAVIGTALLVVPPGQAGVPAGAMGIDFRPHRAVYDITFDHATPGSGVADMSGRMVYEMTGSRCGGYSQSMRFVTRMTNQEGVAQINDLRTTSFEDIAKHHLRFSSSQYENEKLSEASQGIAEPANGATFTEVKLTKPAKKTVKLPSDIYFPIQHSLALMDAARAGKSVFLANLYDGSDKGEKFYETNAVIGARSEPGAASAPDNVPNAGELAKLASWPIAIGYFEPGPSQTDAIPSYELSFRFYENGVSTNLYIDYGDFAIRGELKELTFLNETECPSKSP
ncbi:MAG TPA: cell envelope integrity EipB family protein [Hyphomicrobium sp.]